MVYKICLLISQELSKYNHKKKRTLIMLLNGNQKGYMGFNYKMKFNRDTLIVKRNSCANKIVNTYNVYELNHSHKK